MKSSSPRAKVKIGGWLGPTDMYFQTKGARAAIRDLCYGPLARPSRVTSICIKCQKQPQTINKMCASCQGLKEFK